MKRFGADCSSIPGRLQQEHEGSRAPVHDRHLGCIHFNARVVDAKAREAPTTNARRSKPWLRPAPAWCPGSSRRHWPRAPGCPRAPTRSVRWNTMPVSVLAGPHRHEHVLCPVCKPTPVARMLLRIVRCPTMFRTVPQPHYRGPSKLRRNPRSGSKGHRQLTIIGARHSCGTRSLSSLELKPSCRPQDARCIAVIGGAFKGTAFTPRLHRVSQASGMHD